MFHYVNFITASAGKVLWTPAEITTIGWYDPSDTDTITSVGGDVSQLDDKSGNDYHLVQAVGVNQPETGTRTINDLNVLDVENAEYMDYAAFPVPSSGKISMFQVWQVDSTNSLNDSLISLDSAVNDFQLKTNTTGAGFYGLLDVSFASNIILTGGIRNGPAILSLIFDYGTGISTFMDGNDSGSQTDYSGTKLDTSQSLIIFSNRSMLKSPDGAFGEIVICEDTTTETRQKIEGYLAWKWGNEANLPSGHPYKDAPPYI